MRRREIHDVLVSPGLASTMAVPLQMWMMVSGTPVAVSGRSWPLFLDLRGKSWYSICVRVRVQKSIKKLPPPISYPFYRLHLTLRP